MSVPRRSAALVTGGSRGIGAATVLELARRGFAVAFTYRNKAARAHEVAAAAAAHDVHALPVGADMTNADDLARLFAEVAGWTSALDVLVLNASGGMERDLVAADPDYPLKINRDAQVAIVDRSLPLMSDGGTIVFVTSHWAHLYGRVAQMPGYEPVAASKHAGEQALRARQTELTQAGIRLLVVTGDLIEGTITPKLLERAAPGLAQGRRDAIGKLPTTEDMARAIVAAALDLSLPSGDTIVVGGRLEDLTG